MKLNLEALKPEYRGVNISKVGLFNEDGSDRFEDQMLVGGNPTGIFNLNTVRHSWAVSLYQQMLGNYWLPQTVDMTDDKVSIKTLDEDEYEAMENTLGFLIFMDGFQGANLPNITEYISAVAPKMCINAQMFQEGIHTQSYQYIAEALIPVMRRDALYDRWRTVPALLDRIRFIAGVAEDFLEKRDMDSFYKVLVANYILEGLYFYQGFNFFDQLAHRNKLVQAAKQIDYIRRDEFTHLGIFINIIKDIGVDHQLIKWMMEKAVANEIEWCHYVYGDRILGISKQSSELYVKWLANERLGRLGIEPLYPNINNPYQHLTESNREGGTRGNFFETSITSYDLADSLVGWDDL